MDLLKKLYHLSIIEFAMSKEVSYQHEDRQWDIRINVQEDTYLQAIVENAMLMWSDGKLRYILVGGPEVGTRPNQGDYQIRHIHVATIFHNRISKSSIIKHLGIKEGNGYYLVPRNRDLPYAGWRDHHIKLFSKVKPDETILFEKGELPRDKREHTFVKRSDEEKKRKVDDILIEMRKMYEEGKDEECFQKFPKNTVIYGARLKAMVQQKQNFFGDRRDPHIWLYGFAGTGKTTILRYIYPTMYKKDLSNRFFDLYDPEKHTHICLEDLDPDAVERLGVQFLKTCCDEMGFPIDQKYKTPQLTRSTILVTSNYTITDILPHDMKGLTVTQAALLRRFWHVRIDNLLRLVGVKLLDKYERKMLQKQGNEDVSKLFFSYDYVTEQPTGLPIPSPEKMQEIIREYYYA